MNQDQSIDTPKNVREGLAATISRFLFGNDAFISYARRDASFYSLELATQLTKNELSSFLDQYGTPSGKELPAVVLLTLKRSSMLILLGTENAAGSDAVKKEIIEFKKTGRPIIPVSINGALEKAEWYDDLIAGISIAPETEEALKTAKPSANVIDRIVNAQNFTRRNKRLRNYFWITAASVVMMLLVGALVGFLIVRNANAKAQAAELNRKDAVRQAEQADEQRKKALAEASKFSAEAQQARDRQQEAEGKAEDAAKKEAEASANARKQEQLAIAQKKIADEQTRIANEQQERSRRLNYIGNMQLAQQTLEMGKVEKSERLLSELSSTTDGKDLRGYEWFYLWNALHRKQAEVPVSSSDALISSFAYLPGKNQFVTADYKTLKLWDAKSNEMIAKVDGSFDHVSFSRDGSMIAAKTKNAIKIFHSQNLAPMKGIEQWPKKFRAIAFSPAQNSLLVTADESEINVWEVTADGMRPTGKTIPAPPSVSSLAFSPDGQHLGINADKKIEFWDIAFTNKSPVVESGLPFNEFLLFPDNQTVYFIEGNNIFQLWDFKSGKSNNSFSLNVGVKAVPSPDQKITATISPNGKILAAVARDGVSYDGGVKLWNIESGKPVLTFDGLGLKGGVSTLAFSEDGKTLAIGSGDKVQFSNATPLHSVTELQLVEPQESVPIVSADGHVLIASNPSSLSFYNANTRQFERKHERKGKGHVSFSADGSKYATTTMKAGRRRLIEIFDSRTNSSLGAPVGETTEPQVLLSPDGKTVVVGIENDHRFKCDARCLQFWDVATGAKTSGIPSQVEKKPPSNGSVPLIFSPNSKLLIFKNNVSDGHSIDVLDVATKKSVAVIGDFHEGDFTSFAFSPDGNMLAVASKDSTITIWDVSSLYDMKGPIPDPAEEWKLGDKHFVARLEGHSDEITSVAFSRDGQTLATASRDGTVKLWDTRFYQSMLTLQGHKGVVNFLSFSGDGQSLITVDYDDVDKGYSIKFWRAATREDVAARGR